MARIVQMVTTLALVPLLVRSLGPERFAVWIAVSSLMGAISFVDLGIGSFVVNEITALRGDEMALTGRRSVSNAAAALLIVSGGLATLVGVAYLTIGQLPGRDPTSGPSETAFLTACLSLCLAAPLSLVFRLRLALKEIEVHSLWDMLASILTFVAILGAARSHAGLEACIIPFCTIPLLVFVWNGFYLFRRHQELVPHFSLVTTKEMLAAARGGMRFFALNALSAACFSFDSVLAVRLLSPQAAAEFGVAQRVALGMQTLLTVSLTPFWPRFWTALHSRQRFAAVKVLQVAILWSVSLSVPISFVIMTYGSSAIALWTGGSMVISDRVTFAVAIWIPLFALMAVASALMNVPILVKKQLQLLFISVLGSLAAKLLLGHWLGPAGLFWGNIIALGALMVVPAYLIIWRSLRAW